MAEQEAIAGEVAKEIESLAERLSAEAFARDEVVAAMPIVAEREQAQRRVAEKITRRAPHIIRATAESRRLLDLAAAQVFQDNRLQARRTAAGMRNILIAGTGVLILLTGVGLVGLTYAMDVGGGLTKQSFLPGGNLFWWVVGFLATLPLFGVAFAFVDRYARRARLADRRLRLLLDSPLDPSSWSKLEGAAILERAHSEWVTAVMELGVLPIVAEELAELEPSQDRRLPVLSVHALADITESAQFVETAASLQLERIRTNMTTASIGLSGPRGVGKSALLLRLTDPRLRGDQPGLSVLVQAPTSYDAREFLVDLFAQVCRQVLGATSLAVPRPPRSRLDGFKRFSRRRWRWWAVLSACGMVVLLGALFAPWIDDLGQWAREHSRAIAAFAGGALALSGAVAGLQSSRRRMNAALSRWRGGLEDEAYEHLRTLHYLRTRSAEWSGSVKAPVAELAHKRHLQEAERASTYPELVRQFRDFVERVGLSERARYGDRAITTICIDEIDKISSADEAERFLNDIKAIFGVNSCHYLVSVSEDALASFERRALTVRTAFDSSFDLVVRLSRLELDQTRQLLVRRLVRIPEPFVAMCHALSGGLPRDLLRTTRSLLDAYGRGMTDLAEVAHELISADVRAVLDGQLIVLRRIGTVEGEAATRWLAEVSRDSVDADVLMNAGRADFPAFDGPLDDQAMAVRRLAVQAQAYLAYAATLLRIFSDRYRPVAPAIVEALSTARAQLATDPETSALLVTKARKELDLD